MSDLAKQLPPVNQQTLAELHRQMEQLAAASRWEDLEVLMHERNDLLQRFAGQERAEALQAAQKSTDRILKLASSAKLEVAGELAKLQRGRKATDIYRAHR